MLRRPRSADRNALRAGAYVDRLGIPAPSKPTHPHYHVLLVHEQNLGAAATAALKAHIHARLAPSCRDFGLRQPDQVHSVRIDPNVSASAACAYVAIGGHWTPAEEMTRGGLKSSRTGSRTPFQILADYYQTGDTHDRDLWREQSGVTRMLAAVRWPRGLRALLLGVAAGPVRTDDELAAEEFNGELLAVIEVTAWSRLQLAGFDLAVLVAAEAGGATAGNAVISDTGRRLNKLR